MKKKLIARCTGALLMGATLATVQLPAWAQAGSPDKPIRLVVPLGVGSTVDSVARAIGPGFSAVTGRPIIVENLGGGGGIVGTTQIVKARKDGDTLGMISSNHVINPGIYKSLPYDSLKDITPIAVFVTVPLVLVTKPSLPVTNVKDLVALVNAEPGKYNYGSAGNGSTLHLAAELFQREAKVDIKHVPYRGTGQLVVDLMGGQVDLGFVSVSAAAPQIKAGTLRALAVTTLTRVPSLPDVPTMVEAGVPDFSFDAWIALIGPADLPNDIVETNYQALKKALTSTEAQSAVGGQGLMLMDVGPDAAPAFFAAELAKHQQLIKQSQAMLD